MDFKSAAGHEPSPLKGLEHERVKRLET